MRIGQHSSQASIQALGGVFSGHPRYPNGWSANGDGTWYNPKGFTIHSDSVERRRFELSNRRGRTVGHFLTLESAMRTRYTPDQEQLPLVETHMLGYRVDTSEYIKYWQVTQYTVTAWNKKTLVYMDDFRDAVKTPVWTPTDAWFKTEQAAFNHLRIKIDSRTKELKEDLERLKLAKRLVVQKSVHVVKRDPRVLKGKLKL